MKSLHLPHNFFRPFNSEMIPGLIVATVFAVLSTLALCSVAGRVAWLAIPLLRSNSARPLPREYVFFRTQLGIYSICLLTANFFNGVAGVIGLSWLREMGIREGPLCTAQSVIMQMGNFGTAYFTITIAVHTFNSLVLRRRQSLSLAWTVIIVGWFFVLVAAAFPTLSQRSQGSIYGDAGLSCGIKGLYPKAQFYLHLFPIFLASSTSAIVYSIVFLVLRGTLVIKGGIKLTLDPYQRSTLEEYHHFIAAIARSMLWYPFAYITLLIPYSIVRLLALSSFNVSYGSTAFASVCWFLLGFINVLLLYNTFRVLGPAVDARHPMPKDTESFCSPFKATQTSPSVLLTPLSPPPMDYSTQSSPHPPSHQSTPSASSGVSDHPLLFGHKHATNNGSPDSLLTARSLRRAISPYAELNRQIIAMPEPAWRVPDLHIDTDNAYTTPTNSPPSLTPAPRYTRSPAERRPAIEIIPSIAQVNNPVSSMAGRVNHRRPPLSAVANQTSFRPSRTVTMTTMSDYGTEADQKPSPPPSAVVRSRQGPEDIFDYPNSAASSSSDNVRVASGPQDSLYSPGAMTRILPAPKRKPARRAPPSVFDANAMVRSPSSTSSTSKPYSTLPN